MQAREIKVKSDWTEEFGSDEDEAQYVAWLDEVRKRMRQPMPHHGSVEEVTGE